MSGEVPSAECRVPSGRQSPHDNLKARTKQFALRVIKLVEGLPKSATGRVIGQQVIRCGTAVAANYRAACRSRSQAEFIAKIGIVEEEADESVFWLEMVIDSDLLSKSKVGLLLQEANELTAIMAASRKTAKRTSPLGTQHSALGTSS